MSAFLRYWMPVCAYAGLIFYLSSQPHPEEDLPSFVMSFSDKVLHLVEYAILGGLCYRALRRGTNGSWAHAAFPLAVLFTSLYGISDEIHQSFVPFRDSNWLDWVADTIGAAIGAAVMSRLDRLWPVSSASAALGKR